MFPPVFQVGVGVGEAQGLLDKVIVSWRDECGVSDLIHGGRAASLQKYFRKQEAALPGTRGGGVTSGQAQECFLGPEKAPQEVQPTLPGRNKGGLCLLLKTLQSCLNFPISPMSHETQTAASKGLFY